MLNILIVVKQVLMTLSSSGLTYSCFKKVSLYNYACDKHNRYDEMI